MSKITKTSLASFSKAFPQAPSLYSRLNVSKFGFISASNYSQMQDGWGDTTDADDELAALTQKSKENVEDLMGTIQDEGHEVKEKTKDKAYDMKDKAEETAEKVKEKAAGERVGNDDKSGQTLGEKARQTVEEMCVVAKGAKDKIKESVVGKSRDDNVVEDHVPERKVYEDVVESARKVGNLDHEKKD